MKLPNDTKIRFCNCMDALRNHADKCPQCRDYVQAGEGDVCETGHAIIVEHLAYADTNLQFDRSKL